MSAKTIARPDITLTLAADGVTQNAVSSEAFHEDRLGDWRGRPWGETIEPSIGQEVLRMIEDIRRGGDSSCFQVKQRFPSGREFPIEYTTISLGKKNGFVAIGRNLQTMADLHSRLLVAQQAREQDYWKLREIETRYRMLFDATSEAVALVRVTNLRVVEANVVAARTLGLVPGGEFAPNMSPRDRKAFEAMLDRVREQGRAPGIVMHTSLTRSPWSLRATMMKTEADSFYLFQPAPLGASAPAPDQDAAATVDEIIQRHPDGFAMVDRDGVVRRANNTFLDLVQMGAESAVVGQKIKRWLSRPGADISVILGMVQRHGSVRMLATAVEGELGSVTDVEVSAVGDNVNQPEFVGLILRDVTPRAPASGVSRDHAPADAGADLRDGSRSLEEIVREASETLERELIMDALTHCQGNRTTAARYLGVSRQSLHTKLNKYNLA